MKIGDKPIVGIPRIITTKW